MAAPSAEGVTVRNTRLVVYRTGLLQGVAGEDHLAYEVEVGNGADVREFVFVDAHTGKNVDQITGIQDAPQPPRLRRAEPARRPAQLSRRPVLGGG